MLSFNAYLKVYVALAPCDMCKFFDGLAARVREVLRADPLSGAAFLYSNRKRTLLKILYWDGTGLMIICKRLERGMFSWPKDIKGQREKRVIKPSALAMLTEGIDLRDGFQRPRYERP